MSLKVTDQQANIERTNSGASASLSPIYADLKLPLDKDSYQAAYNHEKDSSSLKFEESKIGDNPDLIESTVLALREELSNTSLPADQLARAYGEAMELPETVIAEVISKLSNDNSSNL